MPVTSPEKRRDRNHRRVAVVVAAEAVSLGTAGVRRQKGGERGDRILSVDRGRYHQTPAND